MPPLARRVSPLLWLLGRLPTALQKLVIHLGAPKVSLGASAVIWDVEGRILMVHHTYRHPAWGFPGGLVGRGEQPDAALVRELREELGVDSSINALLHADIDRPVRHLTLYYQVYLRGIPRLATSELDHQCYTALDDLATLIDAPVPVWLMLARARHLSS